MKKLILVFGLLLAGCAGQLATITNFSVTQDQVDAARAGYDGAFLAPLRRYALLPRCNPGQDFIHNGCHDAASLARLRGIDRQIASDFKDVQALMRSGNAPALQAAWTVLTNHIADAKTTSTQLSLN